MIHSMHIIAYKKSFVKKNVGLKADKIRFFKILSVYYQGENASAVKLLCSEVFAVAKVKSEE